MKRIVICCDGTWRRLDEAASTNAARLALAVLPRDDAGTAQLVLHIDGVGAGRGGWRIGRLLDRWIGGLFGAGLDDSIADVYRVLALNYEPGDEIYLFGYSRGAFTARSLGGLIRKCGILSRANAARIGEALALYRSRDPAKNPSCDSVRLFRAECAPGVAIGADDLAWRAARFPETDHSGTHVLSIRYVGVWDTVGALGVPGYVLASPLINHRHQFHDAELSSHVGAARHAVAVDERRPSFAPTLWSNVATLNRGATGADAPYQQRWFPGVHGAVGGGGEDSGLSSLALLWVLEGAEKLGLAVDPAAKAKLVAEGRPDGPLVPTKPAAWSLAPLRKLTARDRDGPDAGDADALSDPVRARWVADRGYRPRTLSKVAALLDGGAGSTGAGRS